jgi:uncharacterized membrane protein HdeD (DUF308 family)
MYSPNGDIVCKGCFYTADALQRQLRGAKNMIMGGIVSIATGILVAPFAFVIIRKLFVLLSATLIVGGIAGIRYGSEVLSRTRRELAMQPR